MKYRRVSKDPLRPITSEMIPYEVPLPFNVTQLYLFLRKLRFSWVNEHEFKVSTQNLNKAERCWFEVIFPGVSFEKGGEVKGDYTYFNLKERGSDKYDLRHPYKYRVRRNNGKMRHLSLPHPHSMLGMTFFIHEYRDSILYYTNRSNFSIRYPRRVARLRVQKDSEFQIKSDKDFFGVEQVDLEYKYATSYFSYARYNNINRFYASLEFRNCERKYPVLLRSDVSKCFDSIYTHTISWVTNGVEASKIQRATAETFGGKFDRLMQYMNFAETSGILIGPEFSRIFAEIILQEVDIRVQRDLLKKGKVLGVNYEIMRYVDDYFIFLANKDDQALVEETLATHLSDFKLHLNDHKQQEFETPLKSHMSVAKLRLKDKINARTFSQIDLESSVPTGRIRLSAREAIFDFKSVIIEFDLEHADLANYYLYVVMRRAAETVGSFRGYIETLELVDEPLKLNDAKDQFLDYAIANIEVAFFVYSGAPSVSHSVKLSQFIVALLEALQETKAGLLRVQYFRDRVFRELETQLATVRDEAAFGVHTLLLIDCLLFVDPEVSERKLRGILDRRGVDIEELDAFAVLTFLRRFSFDHDADSRFKSELLSRAKFLIDRGASDSRHSAESVMLQLSLPSMPGLSERELRAATGYSAGRARALRNSKYQPTLFAWNANDNYRQRLNLKAVQMVY